MLQQTEKDFNYQLIKGKIAEQVFELMFRQSKKYTVIAFGYESIIPEVAQYVDNGQRKLLFENIRNAPDFAVISHDPQSVYLVEVKYKSRVKEGELREIADRIHEKWKLAYLFLATPGGFYFGRCSDIMLSDHMDSLSTDWIEADLQKQYKEFLNEFIA